MNKQHAQDLVLPIPDDRSSLTREHPDYADLLKMVRTHYDTFKSLEDVIGPHNAKQRSRPIYASPGRDFLKQLVKRGKMNDLSFSALISKTAEFCSLTRGLRALPTPHPSVIHSIQLPAGAFAISDLGLIKELTLPGCEPLQFKTRLDAKSINFVIVRPRLSKLGTPSASNWEILLFRTAHGYIPWWVDSNLNPRWSGVL